MLLRGLGCSRSAVVAWLVLHCFRWPNPSSPRRVLGLVLLLIIAQGCSSSGVSDAGVEDAAAARDSGFVDAGFSSDAGFGSDAGFADAGFADAGFASDAEATDTGTVADAGFAADADLSLDAGELDASVSGEDGGFVGDACPVPPALVDGPFAGGTAPATANFLLTDTASQAVFRLSIDGQVLERWSVPVRRPFGVAHDRRNRDGFFVNGAMRSINAADLYRVSYATGAITATISAAEPNGQIWGMHYIFGSDPAHDLIGYQTVNFNGINVIMGKFVTNGMRWFEGGLFQPRVARWYGFYVERYVCDNGATIIYWATRDGNTLELRSWDVNGPLRTYTIPGTTDARGLTRTPRGDFYVVDRQNRRVLHLAPDITIIDSFPTPGPQPSDISYEE